MKWRVALALAALLGACGQRGEEDANDAAMVPLERAAIEAGLVTDPDSADPSGLYERGPDRLCIVPATENFTVGVTTGFADGGGSCSARGSGVHDGSRLRVDLGGGCRFDANFEGDRIGFPARLPDACRSACQDRASLSAASFDQISDSAAEAAAMTDRTGRTLCSAG